jgi:glutaredoxin
MCVLTFLVTPVSNLEVRLYGKPGCHLCERAEEMVEDLSSEYAISLQTLDITSDPALFERYRYEIPVITLADGRSLGGRIDRAELREFFQSFREV